MTISATPLLVLKPLCLSLTYRSTRLESGSRGVFNVTPGRYKQKLSIAVRCSRVANDVSEPAVERRSGNYTDCVWDYEYIQSSMRNDYIEDKYRMQVKEMRQQVLDMLGCVSDQAMQLELINDLQRLGVAYHFEKEIRSILGRIYYKNVVFGDNNMTDADLYTTALAFRLFRQHRYAVPQGMNLATTLMIDGSLSQLNFPADVFRPFLDDTGKFKSSLCADIKGLISLYEASYLATEGQTIMEEAWTFTTANLSKLNNADNAYLDALLAHALDMPLHWRTARYEARWFIEEAYEKKLTMSPLLLHFAKLDFNVVQAMYLEELRNLSRWWKKLGFRQDLKFARDCLVVSYVWGIMASSEPQYAACRKAFAKIIALVSTVDDVYDIYGTLEELELFTDTFERWDITAMGQLPHYMKKCYLACYNCVNEMAYDVLNDKGYDSTPSLKKAWANLTKSYMKEARWFHSGYKPTIDEYMNNAWHTISIPLVSLHGHIFHPKPIMGKQVQYLESHPDLLKWSCITFRLCDDLGTSTDEMARGDIPKAIQCYMNDTGSSEQAARAHIETLVREGWRKVNKLVLEERILPAAGIERLLNLTRASHCFYQYGDGHGIQDGVTKQLMSKLLFDPIPL